MMHDGWMNWGAGGWGGMWFGPIFFLGFLAIAVVSIFGLLGARQGGFGDRVDARAASRQILDERLAKGEIDRDEFEERRKSLES